MEKRSHDLLRPSVRPSRLEEEEEEAHPFSFPHTKVLYARRCGGGVRAKCVAGAVSNTCVNLFPLLPPPPHPHGSQGKKVLEIGGGTARQRTIRFGTLDKKNCSVRSPPSKFKVLLRKSKADPPFLSSSTTNCTCRTTLLPCLEGNLIPFSSLPPGRRTYCALCISRFLFPPLLFLFWELSVGMSPRGRRRENQM